MRKEDFGRTNGRKRGVGGDTAAHFCIIGLIHQTAPTSPTCALCLISHNSTPVHLCTITVPHLHFYSWAYKILFSWLCCSAEHCYGIVGCLEAGAEWYLITFHFLPDWIWSQATMSHHSQCHLHTARHNLVKRQVRIVRKAVWQNLSFWRFDCRVSHSLFENRRIHVSKLGVGEGLSSVNRFLPQVLTVKGLEGRGS